jgi:hypothetical protein
MIVTMPSSSMIWKASRSPVTTVVRMPSARAFSARDAMTSSAS